MFASNFRYGLGPGLLISNLLLDQLYPISKLVQILSSCLFYLDSIFDHLIDRSQLVNSLLNRCLLQSILKSIYYHFKSILFISRSILLINIPAFIKSHPNLGLNSNLFGHQNHDQKPIFKNLCKNVKLSPINLHLFRQSLLLF